VEGDLLLHPERGLLQGQFHIHRQVVAPGRTGRATAAVTAEPSERTAPEAATTERAEDVLEDVAEAGEALEAATGAAGAAAQPVVAVGVVCRALVAVAQHLVGLGGLLELLFAVRIVTVHVGMVLTGKLAVGLLYLLGVGVARDSKDLVVVTFHSYRSPTSSDSSCAVSRTVAMAVS